MVEKLIMERSGQLSVEGIRSYERTSDEQRQKVSSVLSSFASVNKRAMVCTQNQQSISKIVTASQANKENVFEMKDLHGCTINFNFSS